jgi:predicted transcriptional regulator
MERGEAVSEKHVSFENWETMVRVCKRLELRRHVHRYPAENIRALSQALNRNYRRVHENVEAPEGAGLLDRDKEGLRTEYDTLDVAMRVAL